MRERKREIEREREGERKKEREKREKTSWLYSSVNNFQHALRLLLFSPF